MSITTLRPVTPRTETVADISISGSNVYISFVEHNEKFRDLIKDHGFSWGNFDVGWKRECNSLTGSPLDRATEIGIVLLKSNFVISICDEALKGKILNKEFIPEHKRWIQKRIGGSYVGWFAISWEYGNEKLYKAAKAIAGSKWSNPSVVVPPYQYEAILDLVDLYGFKLSKGAKELVESAKKTKEEALVVDMSEPELPIRETHKEEYGICASLRDDD
jgi:hypothetical protein